MSEETNKGIDLNAGHSPASSRGKSYFLGIGINQYQEFPKLNNAVKDVQDVLQLLLDRYDIDEVLTLLDDAATRDGIIEALHQFVSRIKGEDKILIYYSGHGVWDKSIRRGYWIPYDAKLNRIGTFISNTAVKDYLSDIPSKHTLLISDSCFSGSLLQQDQVRYVGALDEIEQLSSRWAICSGRDNEVVADGAPGTNSPFAASIIRNLSSNQQLKLNVAKLADEVMKETKSERYNQVPLYGHMNVFGHRGGQYVFHLKKGAEAAWAMALEKNTLEAYTDFLLLYHNTAYSEEALLKINRLDAEQRAWKLAEEEHSIAGYAKFFKEYKDSPYAREAEIRMKRLLGLNSPSIQPKPSFPEANASGIVSSDGRTGTFKDPRDGKVYKVVKLLDGNWWFAENLNFEMEGGYCYDNDPKNCNKYGRLYTWEAAKIAAPPGWHLPSDEEWTKMVDQYGGARKGNAKDNGEAAYQRLMEGGDSGFAAQLGGWRDPGGSFYFEGSYGSYWSSSPSGSSGAWYYYFDRDYGKLDRYNFDRGFGRSVRCRQGS